jgi:3-isopropylmalate/(R)-2-methylmalate dehydratase small subunit
MATFTKITSRVVPMFVDNIDTDQIIPARFLKVTDKKGLGDQLFCDWRYNPDGSQKPDFILNRPEARGAQILFAGDNFGCGSSREHAPWALTSFGFKAIVSTSMADIFRSNALKNGLLPVILSQTDYRKLKEEILQSSDAELTIDLEKQLIVFPSGHSVEFPIDPFSKFCLLNGVDELEYLQKFSKEVEKYEKTYEL